MEVALKAAKFYAKLQYVEVFFDEDTDRRRRVLQLEFGDELDLHMNIYSRRAFENYIKWIYEHRNIGHGRCKTSISGRREKITVSMLSCSHSVHMKQWPGRQLSKHEEFQCICSMAPQQTVSTLCSASLMMSSLMI